MGEGVPVDYLLSKELKLNVFPNPITSGSIHVLDGCKFGEELKLSVYSIMGAKIDNYTLYETGERLNIGILCDWKRPSSMNIYSFCKKILDQ